MRQPKNGLINLINNQGNRSDNDAPQDQCCFVVFMNFSGGLGGLKGCGLVSNRLLGPRDCVLWVSRLGCRVVVFFFLSVLDFVNGGADTVLWYCSVLLLCISAACFFGGIVIGMPNAPISVLAWAAGGYQGLISGLWFCSHHHYKM